MIIIYEKFSLTKPTARHPFISSVPVLFEALNVQQEKLD
jgi:hypothetical protein